MVQIQKEAPNFTAEAVMPDGSVQEITLSHYRGKYVALFFYPLDWTFVCPTELLAFSDRIEEFKRRNCEVLGVSVDSVHSHLSWRRAPRTEGGIGELTYPLVSDLDKSISRDYGVLLEKLAVALRGTFLIDRDGVVRAVYTTDLPLGRSIDEVLRLVDALQFVEKHGEVCPANWHAGEAGMAPTLEGVKEYARRNNAVVAH